MDVEVDDRHPLETEHSLRVTNGNGDIPEDAETHGAGAEGVMSGRPNEREPSPLDSLDGAARSQARRLERGHAGEGVGVEPRTRGDSLDRVHVRRIVDALDLLAAGRTGVDVAREGGVESGQALRRLGMRRMPGRVEPGERRMADQVQPSASSKRRATAGTPSSVAYAAAAVQSGATSGSGGSGALRSIVAMRR